ncbi:MAG: lamin tail domain-containing protein [Fibrobacterota bacterium]
MIISKYIFNIVYAVVISSIVSFECAVINPPEPKPAREELAGIIISEIHYHPSSSDSMLVNELEFIELYNCGDDDVSLEAVRISDGVDYTFSNVDIIKSNSYLVLASNQSEFEKRYGFKPFGQYSGRLKNSGERIALFDSDALSEFLVVEYGDESPWPLAADGHGKSLVIRSEQIRQTYDASCWRESFAMHGSPGRKDPSPVVVNEIMPHTDLPDEDAIELYNPNDVAVDISGWYLTDDKNVPAKFQIPEGTLIDACGYVVFYSHDFNNDALPAPFNLSQFGEDVYLYSNVTGVFDGGYCHGFSYAAMENGITYGRHINSAGEETFAILREPTLGARNAAPVEAQIVITEMMYHPVNEIDEYIEIKNIGSETVFLYDTEYPDHTWKIEGFGFTFPFDVSLASGEILIAASESVSEPEFRSRNNIHDNVEVYCLAEGGLRNSSDTISIMAPVEYDSGDAAVYYKPVESISYKDEGLWPEAADGEGAALTRKDLRCYANDPDNWAARPPTPGIDER